MSELVTWIKPNGTEIQINEQMEETARKLGWTKKKGRKKKDKVESKED